MIREIRGARKRAYDSPHVRRTLELSCEAPIWPGFVSFNSLFDGPVAIRIRGIMLLA